MPTDQVLTGKTLEPMTRCLILSTPGCKILDAETLASVKSVATKITDLVLEIAKLSYAAGVRDATEGAKQIFSEMARQPKN